MGLSGCARSCDVNSKPQAQTDRSANDMTAGERRYAGVFLLGLALCLSTRMQAQQGNQTPPQANPFKIEVKVNSVLVPVVVRDAEGRSVVDLRREDFQLFDQDKPQAISGFTIQRRMGIENRGPAVEGGISSITPSTAPAPPTRIPERFIVFLFDDLHLDPGDLLRIKKVATKMLAESLNDSDMAAVVTTSGVNSGSLLRTYDVCTFRLTTLRSSFVRKM